MSGDAFAGRSSAGYSLEPVQHEPGEPGSSTAPRVPSPPATPSRPREGLRMRTVVYFFGLLTILAALAWAALLLGVPGEWIGVGLLFGLGITLIKGTRYTPHPR
jgi:hypothetical protein